MKKWVKVLLIIGSILLTLIIAIGLTNCSYFTYAYELRQAPENIVAVRIMERTYYDDKPSTTSVAKELTLEEGKALLDELLALECGYSASGEIFDFSSVYVVVEYADGEIEQIGRNNNGWISPDGKQHYGKYYFKGYDFYDLVKPYVYG